MGSFQRSLTVLFAIGLCTYLGLEVDASHIRTPYPRCTTLSYPYPSAVPLRGCHPLRQAIPDHFTFSGTENKIHHISCMFPYRIQFALCCFRSPLLTASQLISFPAGTKMLQSPAFPILTDLMGSPIRTSSVQRFHTPRQGLSQLGTSFISGRAKSST